MSDFITYANQGATRNLPLSAELVQALSFLPELGLRAHVFSGGQPAIGTSTRRVGSTRHDDGRAADLFFYRGDERLNWANPEHLPVFQDIVRRGREAGITGFGAGPGYMPEGSMHIGFGAPAVWGAGGSSANAPDWLRQAFEGVVGAPAPTMVAAAQPGPRSLAQAPAPSTPNMPMQPSGPMEMPPLGLAGLFGAAVPGFGEMVLPQAPRRPQRSEEDETARRRQALFGRGGLADIYG